MLANDDDRILIERTLGGEREVFGQLYDRYRRRLEGYCYRLLQDRAKAEEAVQTVFVRAFESLGSLANPELFYSWLFTIARNEVYGTLRAARSNGTDELTDEVWDPETPHDTMVRNETSSMVAACIRRLKVEYREVLMLRHFEGFSYTEIASITGSTISSVESRLFKARKALMIQLQLYGE
jgi:RNA polymerase sigma-70 factor, ECF subfamily